MTDVCIALLPTMIAAVWFFGVAALLRLTVAAAASLAAGRLTGRRDGVDSAALVTGLILCLSCPSRVPLWLLVGGCFFAVCIARDALGGLGRNLFNPAMAARAMMLVVFPSSLTGYELPHALSSATPLLSGANWWELAVGRVGGSMGETSALMIGVGFLWLLIRRVIRWPLVPLSLAGFAAVMLLVGEAVVPSLLSGSILFGAVFVFTDYTGQPATTAGRLLFAVFAGALTALLRLYGRYPEGVCFAVLMMNVLSPWLEAITTRKAKEVKV